MATPAVSDNALLEPKGLTTQDGKYVLDHAGISALLRFVRDNSTIDDARETVKELVDAQVAAIEALNQSAQKAVSDLRTFEEQCQADKLALDGQDKIITDALSGDSGDIVKLEAAIKANKAELSKDQDEYDEDVTIAATAVTYAWCWPIGTIVAATIMGVYGSRAVEMQATINGLKGLLTDEDDQIKADKILVADLTLIKADLETLISKIGPAIQAIEGMTSVWHNIGLDLQAVRDWTQDKSAVGSAVVQKINQNSIITKWNNIYTKAYVTEPEQMTLNSYADNLSAVIKAN
ncbi:predicted protein [Sclerotinia sclerotiorum 1980 UF-70]|uniref:Uncharacterized protein n=1 Tax=Sclerotinia sclerotiorum (strain ATCC 18683 / 1980 / Ss-1) TaxID=665079 RepID=A7EZE9_SCLS1|nr:predicted protein [Sclerotinia sclerotiorum 1980 UF-70]EDN94841.1 predicted protein [Sclerotinia sclerotiorum 1980 UF-70]